MDEEAIVAIVALLSVFGFPTMAFFLRGRHKERMRAIETQADARRVAELEGARSELEARVRTLESIVTAGDHDLEARLRQLSAGHASAHQTPRLQGRPG
jgi:hypothetical protein